MGLTQTRLHSLIISKNWEGAKARLLQRHCKNHEVRTESALGDFPLHLACYSGEAPADLIALLLQAYPEAANKRNGRGFTPVRLAGINYSRTQDRHMRAAVLAVLQRNRRSYASSEDPASEASQNSDIQFPRRPVKIGSISGETLKELYKTPTCVICMDKEPSHVVLPCGHLCLCEDCVGSMETLPACPMGRCTFTSIARVQGTTPCVGLQEVIGEIKAQ